jgi:hypothetical protein
MGEYARPGIGGRDRAPPEQSAEHSKSSRTSAATVDATNDAYPPEAAALLALGSTSRR